MTQTTDALTGATINEPPGSRSTGAGATTDAAREQARSVTQAGREQAGEIVRDASAHARELLGTTRDELRGHATDQTDRMASTLHDVHRQLDGISRGEAPSGMVADITNQLASLAGRTADRLEQGGFEGVLADLKAFARRRPGVFLLGALGAGAVVGRLLRASDTHQLMDAVKGETSDAGGAPIGAPGMSGVIPGAAMPGVTPAPMPHPIPADAPVPISDLSGLGAEESRVPGYPEGSSAHTEV